ncbi:MAG: hypothetical protein M5U19_09975 [Microthrixaceae bacterium]|nr:hypothetical protein [Microthrixaceae bacterium]
MAKDALLVVVDGEPADLSSRLPDGAEVRIVTRKDTAAPRSPATLHRPRVGTGGPRVVARRHLRRWACDRERVLLRLRATRRGFVLRGRLGAHHRTHAQDHRGRPALRSASSCRSTMPGS